MTKTTTYAVLCLLGLTLCSGANTKTGRANADNSAANRAPLAVRFEANAGQLDDEVRFVARRGASALFLTSSGSVFVVCDDRSVGARPHDPFRRGLEPIDALRPRVSVVRMRLEGAHGAPRIEGLGELPGRTNYFIGASPESWRTDVRAYAGVRYTGVYDGVDLVYHDGGGRVEYDFVVAPLNAPKDKNWLRLPPPIVWQAHVGPDIRLTG
jgi:hypothetical protein